MHSDAFSMSYETRVQGISRMSKVKMRCTVCGKWFQSANAKEVTCPDCVQKARKEKLAAKNAPPSTQKPAEAANTKGASRSPVLSPKPKPHVQSGTNQWLDKLEDVKVGQPEPPPVRPKPSSPPVQRDQHAVQGTSGNLESTKSYTHHRNESERGPGGYRSGGGSGLASGFGQRPRVPQEGNPVRGPHSGTKPAHAGEKGGRSPRGKNKPRIPKEPPPPKPPREKIPPPPPFVPTPEQIKQVEERYMELAQPIEFDGIRTQIANELHIPKKAVKQIVKNLRTQSHIPSWWELQTYKGSTEELDAIKALYEPYLPLPPIGVHKAIAKQLSIKSGVAYQAIKTIRQELGLPQYNDPALHEEEQEQEQEQVSNSKEASSEPPPVSAQPEGEIVQLAPVPADQTSSSNES
jgi:hypothetical protein